ncbi:MAG: DNA repair protein RecO [Rhodanobacteraceae bacterium]|nr:MAG: DNA repair protein RecO [Rhodanobacteraceae bacterium]
MRVTAQPAYVLHTQAWRETSLLVEAFTRDFGRVGLVARGVRGARKRLSRSALEPLQALRLDWSGRGELQTLGAAEPDGLPCALRGDRLLSALYVNELMVRLTARNDANAWLFGRYAALLADLPVVPAPGWRLRCFERDLMTALGYAMQLDTVADTGAPVAAAAWYDYVPEQGPVAAGAAAQGVRLRGSALLALANAGDTPPGAEDLAALRRLMRMLIVNLAGRRGLESWRVLAESARVN